MSAKGIAELYADSMSRDANRELVADIEEAIREAVKERDMEWWEKCCLVDNVTPTPDGVKEWVTIYGQYCSDTERERCAVIAKTFAEELIADGNRIMGKPSSVAFEIERRIRRGTPPATEPPAPSPPQSDGGDP